MVVSYWISLACLQLMDPDAPYIKERACMRATADGAEVCDSASCSEVPFKHVFVS